jgi:hypothetical protein
LPDQAVIPLTPALPVRRSRDRDNYLLEMVIPLERQVADWRALNRLFNNRTVLFPLRIDVHTRNAVRPRVYIQAVLNRLHDLLKSEAYPDVEVILITGRGRHSRQQGFSKLQKSVLRIAAERNLVVRNSTYPGRLLLNFRNGQ